MKLGINLGIDLGMDLRMDLRMDYKSCSEAAYNLNTQNMVEKTEMEEYN